MNVLKILVEALNLSEFVDEDSGIGVWRYECLGLFDWIFWAVVQFWLLFLRFLGNRMNMDELRGFDECEVKGF